MKNTTDEAVPQTLGGLVLNRATRRFAAHNINHPERFKQR